MLLKITIRRCHFRIPLFFNKNLSLSIDWVNHSITFELNNCKHFIECSKLPSRSLVSSKSLSEYSSSLIYSCVIDPALQFYYFNIDATQLPHYEQRLLDSILDDFQEVFPNELPLTLPPKQNVDHQIELIPGVAHVSIPPCCHNLPMRVAKPHIYTFSSAP